MGDNKSPGLVTHMTRERVLAQKIRQSEEIIRQGIVDHVLNDGRRVAAMAVLFSGGNDSTVLLHLLRNVADLAIHANTGIGIDQTRQYVRDTCAAWNVPLMEESPPVPYEDLVLEAGFPGPAHHYKMFQRLKERCIRQARRKLVKNPYRERLVLFAGRRNAESQRREKLPDQGDRVGSQVYISPIIHWDSHDMNAYRAMHDLPRNPVSDTLHMSGECLCGSFAANGEREELAFWFPEVDQRIRSLEDRVRALGTIPERRCTWGWGAFEGKGSARKSKVGIMCTSCDARAHGGEIVSTNAGPLPSRSAVADLPTITRPEDLLLAS